MKRLIQILVLLVPLATPAYSDYPSALFEEEITQYSPGSFLPEFPQNYTYAYFPSDSLSNSDIVIYGTFPWIGYPSRPPILPGLNDTLHFAIRLHNHTDKPYILTDKAVSEWFVPQVYGLEQDIHKDTPIADERSLKFKFRAIGGNPDTLQANSWDVELVYSVWNLPTGTLRLVAAPTDRVPKEFLARKTGGEYQLKKVGDLADTTNALEAEYLRLTRAGKWNEAKAIPDSIITMNPRSIVGWALKKLWCWEQDDLTCASAALDSAYKFLVEELDPAAPTEKERKDDEHKQRWYKHLKGLFERERSWLDTH